MERRGVGIEAVAIGAGDDAGVATETVTGVGENAGVDVGNRAGAGGVMMTGDFAAAGVGAAAGGANGDGGAWLPLPKLG